MDIRSMLGAYLKAADVIERAARLTIKDCLIEQVGQGESAEMKHVLYFQGTEKKMVLNVVNATVLADAFGSETDKWRGSQIELYADKTMFNGKLVDCIRCRLPSTQVNAPAPPVEHGPPADYQSQATGKHDEDSIPF